MTCHTLRFSFIKVLIVFNGIFAVIKVFNKIRALLNGNLCVGFILNVGSHPELLEAVSSCQF